MKSTLSRSTLLHTTRTAFAEQEDSKEKLARIRITNQRICLFKDRFNAAPNSVAYANVVVRSCVDDAQWTKTQVGDWIITPELVARDSNGGSVLKWRCGTRQNPQWCPPGTEICATFLTYNKKRTLVQERCDAHLYSHSLFLFSNKNDLWSTYVKIRPDDKEWLCVTGDCNLLNHNNSQVCIHHGEYIPIHTVLA